MFHVSKTLTTLLVPIALFGATTGLVAGCGDGGIDKSKVNDLKNQAKDIQAKSAKVQADVKKIEADVQSGKISAAAGQKKIEAETTQLQKQATDIANNGIDAIKNNSHLSADQKKQLEQLQQQVNAGSASK